MRSNHHFDDIYYLFWGLGSGIIVNSIFTWILKVKHDLRPQNSSIAIFWKRKPPINHLVEGNSKSPYINRTTMPFSFICKNHFWGQIVKSAKSSYLVARHSRKIWDLWASKVAELIERSLFIRYENILWFEI